ncbi:homeobox-leucine zipper protein HOX11 [Ananas comosus]|uniref:Homeobox-leucine zipper protein HOX11 n=1 Tax=Ananas comosus TaxID=4615 RepID=A0A6P5GWU2_ANACO|nr:homeobox-leucine zipper protein HOX11 [Ananas comosus]
MYCNMELGLSLGEAPTKPVVVGEKGLVKVGKGLGLELGVGLGRRESEEEELEEEEEDGGARTKKGGEEKLHGPAGKSASHEQLIRLSLVPSSAPPPPPPPPPLPQQQKPVFPWAYENRNLEAGSIRGFDVNMAPSESSSSEEEEEMVEGAGAPTSSSPPPNSSVSFQMELSGRRGRGSDEEENGSPRKKLRLSKEQSAYLEESFKEHSTLNPKQKIALAKQLNLRPRQVEVWFQNRRARTKLKQTEVDCEYLKRCCETLTEENRRLHKELAELRALKTASNPFYMHLPATTLSMCPSCERTTSSSSASRPSPFVSFFSKPPFHPLAAAHSMASPRQPSATS